MTTSLAVNDDYLSKIITKKYGSSDWQRYNKRIWDQIYTKVPKPMHFEAFFYSHAEHMTDGEYKCGQWEVVGIAAGGFYLRPVCDSPFQPQITVYSCFSQHTVSYDAFGLACSIMCFANWQGMTMPSEYLSTLYENCRDLAFTGISSHPEYSEILTIID